jgi:iron complex outermembrane recepter protein
MKNILLMAALLWATGTAVAQGTTITGQVTSPQDQPIEGAIVQLFRTQDSTLTKTELTDADGRYEFSGIGVGEYRLFVSQLNNVHRGAPFAVEGQPTLALSKIQLTESSVQLSGVTVTSKTPFVERKIDRVVVNVDALISNAGTNALEVLEKSPGVTVDQDGGLRLKGRAGVMVFIDDKPTYLSSDELANYLRTLPSGSLDKIEIMTNPPAKYDAAGNAGVINIRLKKNTITGLSGGISVSYGQGFYHRTNNSGNINYRINKFNFFANAAYVENNSYQDLTIWRDYFSPNGAPLSSFVQNSFIKRGRDSRNARAGMDFYINKKSTLGVVLSGFSNPNSEVITNAATLSDGTNQPISRTQSTNPANGTWLNGTTNLNYTYKISEKGGELSTNLDHIRYRSELEQTLTNTVFSPQNVLESSTVLESELPATIGISTAKVDYSRPLPGEANMEAGAKASWVETDNTAAFFDAENGVRTPNLAFSNQFRYKEQIQAAYLNYNKTIGKLGLQTGLRFERTAIEGNQLGNAQVPDSTFQRQYNSLFPTIYASYTLDSVGKHQLGLSLGRRIQRPNYQDMNPFTYPIDRFTLYGGNPFLQPTFSYNTELSYTYNNAITLGFQYNYTNDEISETIETRNGIFYSRPGNFGKSITAGISLNATLNPTSWWTIQCYTEVMRNQYESQIYGQVLDTAGIYWFIGPNNQFQLNKKWSAELSGYYQTRIISGQFALIPVGSIRAGVSCRLFDGKGTIKLNVSDLFYTNQPGGRIFSIADSRGRWLSYLDSRVVNVAFSYRFSKGQTLKARKTGGSETETGRIRT